MGTEDSGVPEICCSFLIRCAKQRRVSATVIMRVRGGLGERLIHPLFIDWEGAQNFATSSAKHYI